MKNFVLALAVVSAFSGSAFAGEICGIIGSRTVSPKCASGQFCPRFVRLQYDITTDAGAVYDLETSDSSVFQNFTQLQGEKVCINGTEQANVIEVAQILTQ